MNQTTIDTNFRRLGLWVGYRRKRLLNQTKLARYRQENFILTNRVDPYFDYPSGHAVCSRTTLSNLENGGILREPSLLPYFMRKLGITARFSESNWLLTQTLYERLDDDLRSNSAFSSVNWLSEFESHASVSLDNVLFHCEYPWLKTFLTWLSDPTDTYDVDIQEFLSIYPIINPLLQRSLSDWIAFMILSQPSEWPHAMHDLNRLIEDGNHGELSATIWHLFKGNILFTHRHFNAMFENYAPMCKIASVYHPYLNLILNGKLVAKINPLEQDSQSFVLYKRISVIINDLKKDDPKQLIALLRHEPYPHAFRKHWILEMARHFKAKGHYKRFHDLFVDLNSIDQGLE